MICRHQKIIVPLPFLYLIWPLKFSYREVDPQIHHFFNTSETSSFFHSEENASHI